MDEPTLIPLDLASDAGRHLLASVEARQGPNFVALARLPSRIFALRSAWAPGLGFVGAEVSPPHAGAGQNFSLGGTGETLEDALVSCLGEGAERLSQIERSGDIACRQSAERCRDAILPAAWPLIDAIIGTAASESVEADWVAAADLATGREVLLPADWCLRRAVAGPLTLAGTAPSTGAAAGPTATGAAVRALLELIERDAVAAWWIGGRRGRPLAADDPATAEAAEVLAALRQGERKRMSWYLDLTTDLGIPCVAALSVSPAGDTMACGMAARLSLAAAVRAATFEMGQMELGYQLIALKRRQRGDDALNPADRRHLARAATIHADTCALLHPAGTPRLWALPPPEDDDAALAAIATCLAAVSIDAALVEVTRPEYGIPVIVAVAPALQRLPGDIQVARLTSVIARTGGGERWTGGLPIL